jgi:hypothetical protein
VQGEPSLLPLPGLSGAGQNLSRPSVTAGQPHPSSCLVNVHAKTALTEPARTWSWQLSEAGTRVARALTLKRHTHCKGIIRSVVNKLLTTKRLNHTMRTSS